MVFKISYRKLLSNVNLMNQKPKLQFCQDQILNKKLILPLEIKWKKQKFNNPIVQHVDQT